MVKCKCPKALSTVPRRLKYSLISHYCYRCQCRPHWRQSVVARTAAFQNWVCLYPRSSCLFLLATWPAGTTGHSGLPISFRFAWSIPSLGLGACPWLLQPLFPGSSPGCVFPEYLLRPSLTTVSVTHCCVTNCPKTQQLRNLMGAKVEESDSGLLARRQSRHHLGCSFATPEWGWLISKLAHVVLPCSRAAGFSQSKRSGKEGESKMEAESSYPISAVTAPPCLPCSVWEKWVQLPPGGRGLYTGRTTRRWGSLGPSQRPPTHSCLLQDNTCASIKTALTVCSLTRLHFSLVLTLMLYSVSICLSSNSTWTSTSRRQGLFTCLPLYPQHSKLGQAGSRLSFMPSQWTNDCVHICLECECLSTTAPAGRESCDRTDTTLYTHELTLANSARAVTSSKKKGN